jgi:hypothetical protein
VLKPITVANHQTAVSEKLVTITDITAQIKKYRAPDKISAKNIFAKTSDLLCIALYPFG